MSVLKLSGVVDQLVLDVAQAWQVDKVYTERPREEARAPYAIVDIAGSDRTFANSVKVRFKHSFQITGRFKFAANARLLDAKIANADALIPLLLTNAVYASVAGLPTVDRIEYAELDDVGERAYEVRVLFSVETEGMRDGS